MNNTNIILPKKVGVNRLIYPYFFVSKTISNINTILEYRLKNK